MEQDIHTVSENQMFRHYGRLTEQCFAEDLPPGAPISVFPKGISGIKTGKGGEGHRTGHLDFFADKEQMAFVQKSVDRLREGLMAESVATTGRSLGPVTQKFNEFKNALSSGREAMLNENPFYELTGLIFRLNQTAMKNAFIADQDDAENQLPGAIKASRSLRHLWGRDGAMISQREKIRETLGKVLSIGKIGVGLFLYLTSSLTTAKAIADIVQEDFFIRIFGDGLNGPAHESVRLLVSLFIGLAFSSVILDFKDRMFQGIAEAGRVFVGVWQSFQRFPRWMVLSFFLTAFSIWTNYDGIVLLFSKTQDLTYQWSLIEKQVLSALGDPKNTNLSQPDSLADLGALLDKTVMDAVAKFKQIPVDEKSGAASSGKAEKGPRYWAKYFIVEGGYEPGVQDVVRAYKSTQAAMDLDRLLLGAKMDLKTPLEEELKHIAAGYAVDLARTREDVLRDMKVLHGRMVMDHFSLTGLQAEFQLEAYHINESVAGMVAKLEASTETFAAVSRELHKVTENHVSLLRKMDQYGIPVDTKYSIDVQVSVPRVEAIDQLKHGRIPEAKRRTLAELRQFLFDTYGIVVGASILGFIVFIAVFMDLSDPILYSTMVARWGRRDRHFLEDNQQRFLLWEEAYVRRLRNFFVRPEIRPVMPSLACPGHLVFTHLFDYHIEAVYPQTKDPSSRTTWESFRFWFVELFSNTRMAGVLGYNHRHSAIRRFIRQKETFASRLINQVFPGLLDSFTPGISHFDILRQRVVSGQEVHEKRFLDELADAKKESDRESQTIASKSQNPEGQTDVESRPNTGRVMFWIRLLFIGSFRGPPEGCPLTRISWLKRTARLRSSTESSQYHLASFAPILKDWLAVSVFPNLRETTIQPLERLLQGIPNRRMMEDALDLPAIHGQLEILQRTLTEILGLSMFHGGHLDMHVLTSMLSSTGFPEIAEIFLFRRQDISLLERRLEEIKNRLDSIHQVLGALVDSQDAIVEVLTRIRTHHLSPMNTILERMENRPFFEKSLRLDLLFRDLINMERFMVRMWDAADAGSFGSGELVRDGSQVRDSESNPMLRYLVCNRGESKLTLLDKMQQLEVHTEETHKKLNAIVFILTFIDKLAIKVRGQLEEILDMQQAVLEIDRRHKGMTIGGVGSIDRKYLDFMENNHLFFLSLPAKVNTMFERIDSLLGDPGVADAHNVELFRGLESRTFKMHQFMKNTLEFFDGRRDRLELPPSLAFSASGGALPGGGNTREMVDGVGVVGTAHTPEAISQCLKRIRDNLREISLVEWDLLKLPIPPQAIMEVFEESRSFIEQSWVEVERIQQALDGRSLGNESVNLELLDNQAHTLLGSLEAIQKKVEALPVVDRRLTREHTLEIDAGRRQVDHGAEEYCQQQVKSSRRSVERVVVSHPVELRFGGVGTLKGFIRDVSKTGVCVETDQLPSSALKQEMEGSIRLVSDKQGNKINCRIKRLTGHMLGLVIEESNQAAFAAVVRREITGVKSAVAG